MRRDRPSGSIRRLPTESGLLLIDTAANCLWAYNDTARQAWEFLEQGCSHNELAANFAERFAIPEPVARRDIRTIIRQWRSQGLLQANGGHRPTKHASTEKPAADWSRASKPRWTATFTCTIRDKVFAFAVEPAHAARTLRIFFRHLQTPRARPDVCLEVRAAGDGENALLVDGTERLRTGDVQTLIGLVNRIILEEIHPGIHWLALIHGGAVARHGAGFAFPAASGSGKSTLIAYLLARGGYSYLADDLVALSAPDGRIVPWPLPMSIKQGSWDVLAECYRDLRSFPRYRTKGGEAHQILPHPQAWRPDPLPVGGFIFPRYIPGAVAKLTRLTPFEALERLLGDRIWLGYPLTEQRVRDFLVWFDRTPAYCLVHGDVADAARLIEDIA